MKPPSSPRIAFVCAWYGRADHVEDTLGSLLSQDVDAPFEVVVVNDGSTDPRVARRLDRVGANDPRVRVVHQENAGFTRAIRSAIKETMAPFVAIQGAGDVSLPGRLRRQLEILDRDERIGMVGCRYRNVVVEGGAIRKTGRESPVVGALSLADFLGVRNPFCHGSVTFRRSLYDRVGGYRPFFHLAQDKDLWLRMASHATPACTDDVLYERRVFVEDGVEASRDKIILQGALAAFAEQCHEERVRHGEDFVDRYGDAAALFRRPSEKFARRLAKQSLEALLSGDDVRAAEIARLAIDERRGAASTFADAFVRFSTSTGGWPVRALRPLLRLHPNYPLWTARR